MKIIIDGRELRTSTGRYIERLLHYLQAIDTKNQYTVLLKPQDMIGWKPTSPNFTVLASPFKEFTFGEQLGFRRQLKRLKGDLVHFGMVQQPILYKGKVVTTIHDLTTARFRNPDKNIIVFKIKQLVYKIVIRRAAKKSAAIIVPSEYVKNDVAAFTGVNPNKITVTYESADPILDNPEPLTELIGKRFLMYVGRPTPHKNLPRLINAHQALLAKYPDLILVLAGKIDNNYRRIQDSVKTHDQQNIIFTDFVSEGQLRWLYEHCAAYVFPSLSEGFGLPGLEAMLHGAPVVSSNATCLPEIYGSSARYFDPHMTHSITMTIDLVLSDADVRATLIANGRDHVKQFSWQRMAEQTLSVYETAYRSI